MWAHLWKVEVVSVPGIHSRGGEERIEQVTANWDPEHKSTEESVAHAAMMQAREASEGGIEFKVRSIQLIA